MNIAATLFLLLAMAIPVSAQLLSTSQPRNDRETYLQFGWQGFSTNTYYAGSTSIPVYRLSEDSFSIYGEYGYSSRLTGIVHLPGYRVLTLRTEKDAKTVTVEAPGDVELGMRFGLWMSEQASVTLAAVVSLPLGETSDNSGVWTGDDEYNQHFTLGYERRLPVLPLSLGVSAGFNNRNSGYADEIHLAAIVGLTGFGPMGARFVVHAVEPLDNGKKDFHGGDFGFATNRQRYLLYGSEVNIEIFEGFGIAFGAYGLARMENVPSAVTLRGSVFFIFDRPQRED